MFKVRQFISAEQRMQHTGHFTNFCKSFYLTGELFYIDTPCFLCALNKPPAENMQISQCPVLLNVVYMFFCVCSKSFLPTYSQLAIGLRQLSIVPVLGKQKIR